MALFIETGCTFAHEGKTFESRGAYLCNGRGDIPERMKGK
jgi:hypothetical protein